MRTIKFRGKPLHGGGWVYGYLADVDDAPIGKVGVINSRHFSGFEESTMVVAGTIGQYTGLHDRNGKEIYEGDILKSDVSDIPFGVVTWHHDGYFFIDVEFGKRPIGTSFRPLGAMLNARLDYSNAKYVNFEVVGNIHDNA